MTNPPYPPQPGAPGTSGQPYGQPAPPHGRPSQPYGQPPQPYGQPPQPYAQPGQPYPQTGHAGTQHAPQGVQPGQPNDQSSPAASAKRGNPAGLIAAILVAVAVILQLVASIGTAALIGSPDMAYELYGTFTTTLVVLQGLVALTAIVLGAVGLAARDRPKGFAGIGLGGGAVVLFGILGGQLTNLLLVAFRG